MRDRPEARVWRGAVCRRAAWTRDTRKGSAVFVVNAVKNAAGMLPHRAEDWAIPLRLGERVVLEDEIGRAFGSAMWLAASDDLATLGMVITTLRPQERGLGRWMMEQILAQPEGATWR